MGVIFNFFRKNIKNPTTQFVFLGPKQSGKTTGLLRLRYPVDKEIIVLPSLGVNMEEIIYKETILYIYDLTFNIFQKANTLKEQAHEEEDTFDNFSNIFENFSGMNGIVFFVDSLKMKELNYVNSTAEMLKIILQNPKFLKIPILILANMQDLKDAMNAEDIKQALELYNITDRNWIIRESIATTGEGISEGLEWLFSKRK
jgi:GTPase SAR1 family protein